MSAFRSARYLARVFLWLLRNWVLVGVSTALLKFGPVKCDCRITNRVPYLNHVFRLNQIKKKQGNGETQPVEKQLVLSAVVTRTLRGMHISLSSSRVKCKEVRGFRSATEAHIPRVLTRSFKVLANPILLYKIPVRNCPPLQNWQTQIC